MINLIKDLMAIGYHSLAHSCADSLAEPERTEILDYMLWQHIKVGDSSNAERTIKLLGETLSQVARQLMESANIVQCQSN